MDQYIENFEYIDEQQVNSLFDRIIENQKKLTLNEDL